MHTGPAVERAGDWFGATVNLAARVAAAALGGEVLVTGDTQAAARAQSNLELCDRGRLAVKDRADEPRVYSVTPCRARPHVARSLGRRNRRFAPPIKVPTLAAAPHARAARAQLQLAATLSSR